ncbi:hypothetical protein ACFLTG_03435 [Chloroflexota bacterium]
MSRLPNTESNKLDAIDADLNDVEIRLLKLYEVLEAGKLTLDGLAPRIKELRAKRGELIKARVQVEVEMVLHGADHIDIEAVKSYAQDLGICWKSWLYRE